MASLLCRFAQAPARAVRNNVRAAVMSARAFSSGIGGCSKENCGCAAFHSSAAPKSSPQSMLPSYPNPSFGSPASTVEPVTQYGSPDTIFDDVAHGGSATAARDYSYVVLGGARVLYASGVRLGVLKIISTMSASADVLAMGSMEVNLAGIRPGTTFTAKWRGKPVFIRHRTPEEIGKAQNVEATELKDPQKDEERVKNPEWLVVMGVCTHLGCVPVSNQGDYGGWFCPCHGSHYDLSGRIRKGPAPLNLEVPTYKFLNDNTVLLG